MLMQRLLRFRRENRLLFESGSYFPLTVTGEFADCCVAFAREHEGKWIVVLVPRLSSRIGFPPIGDKWKDTAVELPGSFSRARVIEIFTGGELRTKGMPISVSEAMESLPFAAYSNVEKSNGSP
jgi:(1->4)-alpha-D-glucan 1-alpha-D-glucosylmutase